MKTSKFRKEQIAFALKQAELSANVEEICRKLGKSEATYSSLKKKFGGLGFLSCAACANSKRKTRS